MLYSINRASWKEAHKALSQRCGTEFLFYSSNAVHFKETLSLLMSRIATPG